MFLLATWYLSSCWYLSTKPTQPDPRGGMKKIPRLIVYCVTPFTVAVCPFTSNGPSLQFLKLFLREKKWKKPRFLSRLYHWPMFALFGWCQVEFLGWQVECCKGEGKKHQKEEHKTRWNNNSFPTICTSDFYFVQFNYFFGKKLAGSKGPTCWGSHSSYHVYYCPFGIYHYRQVHILCQIGV